MTCNTLYSDGTGISGHSPTPRRESIESLAKHIRLLVLDVDGVMTDGGLYYDANGLVMKRFHVLDGIGIRLAKTADLAPMSRVGLPAAVANAMPDVKKLAKFVTQKEGGCGAVREFVDLLLTCQGKREALLEHWMRLE